MLTGRRQGNEKGNRLVWITSRALIGLVAQEVWADCTRSAPCVRQIFTESTGTCSGRWRESRRTRSTPDTISVRRTGSRTPQTSSPTTSHQTVPSCHYSPKRVQFGCSNWRERVRIELTKRFLSRLAGFEDQSSHQARSAPAPYSKPNLRDGVSRGNRFLNANPRKRLGAMV